MAVIRVPRVNQCADTTRIALGVGISLAILVQRFENSLSSIPFMGDPCPINSTGINCDWVSRPAVNVLKSDKSAIVVILMTD